MADGGLRAIFLEQRPALARLLVARLGNRDDAEYALQDLWVRIDQIGDRPVAQPAAFLYRVANNLATDRRIAGARRSARDAAWLNAQPGADDCPDAERVLVAQGELRMIEAVIADMPERMAAVLRLYRVEQRPQRAIADDLGITVSGVEKLLQRAYRILHTRLAQSAADRDDAHRHDTGRGLSREP